MPMRGTRPGVIGMRRGGVRKICVVKMEDQVRPKKRADLFNFSSTIAQPPAGQLPVREGGQNRSFSLSIV